jgi:hypothetical protein
VEVQVLCCDEPVSLLITGYYLQYSSSGESYQTAVSATQNYTSTSSGITSLFTVPTGSEFILTDLVAVFSPSATGGSACGAFYGNILQNSTVKTNFAFPDLQSGS